MQMCLELASFLGGRVAGVPPLSRAVLQRGRDAGQMRLGTYTLRGLNELAARV